MGINEPDSMQMMNAQDGLQTNLFEVHEKIEEDEESALIDNDR